MRIILIIFECLFALLGYATTYGIYAKKWQGKTKSWIKISIVFGGVVTIFIFIINKHDAIQEANSLKENVESLRTMNSDLKLDIEKLSAKNSHLQESIDSLSNMLNPFVQKAEALFPGLKSEVALRELLTRVDSNIARIGRDVSVIPPRVELFKEDTIYGNDDLVQITYRFQTISNPSAPAGDVLIRISFNQQIDTAAYREACAIKIGESKFAITHDRKSVIYSTRQLDHSCVVLIDVVGRSPLNVIDMKTSP